MTVQDASGAPVKITGRWITRRWIVLAAVLVCMLVTTYVVDRVMGHEDPDPGGRILAALQSVTAAVPDDATDVRRQDTKAHWDSCDGREGTFGWGDVSVNISFKTPTRPDALVSGADGRMAAVGWSPGSPLNSPNGPGRQWLRTLEDGTKAVGQLGPDQTSTWWLSAYAPPHGPRVSGC
jgi:hypothetical protein